MANAFKKGDIVRLKSSGPAMTIDALPNEQVPGKGFMKDCYHCEWFKGATASHGWYGEHLLEAFVAPAG